MGSSAVSLPACLQPALVVGTSVGVFCDFDGTLSSIIPDPTAVVPVTGAAAVLGDLADVVDRIVVVSGRPVAFLVGVLPADVDLVGLYGLERRVGGASSVHPEAEAWQSVIDGVVDRAAAVLSADVRVEHKGRSLTLHTREHPEHAHAVAAFTAAEATATGLVARPAKASIELHPPIEVDKGTVVAEVVHADGLAFAVFIGDDVGDLTAFDALDALAAEGIAVARVAVLSAASPPELVTRADLVVDGPEGAVDLLRELTDARRRVS